MYGRNEGQTHAQKVGLMNEWIVQTKDILTSGGGITINVCSGFKIHGVSKRALQL
jgi:hypothetical protein